MRRVKKYNTALIGFMIGATMPVLGYWAIEVIFTTLTESGVMDEVTSSTFTKRLKTLSLLSICCNLLPAQIANNTRHVELLKGVILATLIYAGLWTMYFYFGIRFF